jgi:hypothetical protein
MNFWAWLSALLGIESMFNAFAQSIKNTGSGGLAAPLSLFGIKGDLSISFAADTAGPGGGGTGVWGIIAGVLQLETQVTAAETAIKNHQTGDVNGEIWLYGRHGKLDLSFTPS